MTGLVHLQVLAICLIAGVAAGCFQMYLWRKQNPGKDKIKIFAFYASVTYGLLAFLKGILGSKDETLFESFSSISARTYLHYIPLILAAGIVIPVVLRYFLRKKDGAHMLSVWDSQFFTITAIVFAVTGKITNLMYLCILVISTVLTLAVEWKLEMKDGTFAGKVKQIAPPAAFWVITVVLCLPGEIYLNNIWEFSVTPWSYAGGLALSAAGYLTVYIFCAAYFLTNIQAKFFSRILFALTLAGYLQNMFLNGYMVQMDGTVQTWSAGLRFANSVIWLVIIAGILTAGARLRGKADKIYKMVCIYIGLIQIVSLGVLIVTSEDIAKVQDTYGAGRVQLTSDGIFELACADNVVVFILDWYDEQILEQILQEDSDFLAPLDGFTCYTNASSLYAYTSMAIPYLLTGVEWEYDMSWREYRLYAYANSNVFADMEDMGYHMEIYTDAEYLTDDALQKVSNSDSVKYKLNIPDQLYVMTKTAKYQMAPFAVKNNYWYTAEDLASFAAEDERVYAVNSEQDDIDFQKRLVSTGLRTDDREKLFKLIHMHGAHPPFGIDESSEKPYNAPMLAQAKNSMEIVYEYIRQMKEIGIYDTSTIIITADHGENYLYDPVGREELVKLCLENTSSPVLLVKHPRQNGDINYSDTPVSQKEVVAEIMKAVNPAATGYGKTLEETGGNEADERIFIYRKGKNKYVKSRIRGDVNNPASWEIIEGLNLEQLK